MKEKTNNDIYHKLESINDLIRVLIRQRKSDKLNLLEDRVKEKARMNKKEVVDFLGCADNWALKLMKRLGNQEGFRFILGNKITKRGSVILFEGHKLRRIQLENLKSLFKDRIKELTFSEIMNKINRDLEFVRELAFDLVGEDKKFQIGGDLSNKLIKID